MKKMIIGLLIIFISSHLVLTTSVVDPANNLLENDQYPFLASKIKYDSQELKKREFEALGKRSDENYLIEELIQENHILKKVIKDLLKASTRSVMEKRGFEALGKRSNNEFKTNFENMFPMYKRGFESLGK